MYIKGGSTFGRSQLKWGFSPIHCLKKKLFYSITIPDQLTWEGAGTPNFKSLGIFHIFPEIFGAKAFRWDIGKPAGVNIVPSAATWNLTTLSLLLSYVFVLCEKVKVHYYWIVSSTKTVGSGGCSVNILYNYFWPLGI